YEQRSDDVVRGILEKLEVQYPTAEQVRALYALQVLERIGNEEARRLLSELAEGAPEAILTRQAKAILGRSPKEEETGKKDTWETMWTDLAGDDAGRAFRAIRLFATRSREATPFLIDRLRPLALRTTPDDDPKRIERLIAELDSNDFAKREEASQELSRLGKGAGTDLQRALKKKKRGGRRVRSGKPPQGAPKPTPSRERERAERALEALERGGTEEARQALKRLGEEARPRWLKDAIAEALRCGNR